MSEEFLGAQSARSLGEELEVLLGPLVPDGMVLAGVMSSDAIGSDLKLRPGLVVQFAPSDGWHYGTRLPSMWLDLELTVAELASVARLEMD